MHELRDRIRKALAGSTSTNPVDTKKLLTLGKADQVTAALEQLLASREINTAKSTIGSITTVLCWLTGSGGVPAANWRSAPPSFPPAAVRQVFPAASVRQPEPRPQVKQPVIEHPSSKITSEIAMKKPTMNLKAIVEIVTKTPGIARNNIYEMFPGADRKKIVSCVSNGIYNGALVQKDFGGAACLFLSEGKKAKAAPGKPEKKTVKKAARQPKAPPVKVAANNGASLAPAIKSDAAPEDNGFSLMLSESGHLHISTGVALVVLTPTQAGRVHRFVERIAQHAL